MWLYRVMAYVDEDSGTFFDATNSKSRAAAEANRLFKTGRFQKVVVEAERWPNLNVLKYHFYVLTGRDEGFGVNFKSRYGHEIEDIEVICSLSA